jgi:hypothetical protein
LPYLSIRKPRAEPRITFITSIRIKLIGSCQLIIKTKGAKSIKEITTPFNAPFILISETVIKNPATIQNTSAEKLASHVNFRLATVPSARDCNEEAVVHINLFIVRGQSPSPTPPCPRLDWIFCFLEFDFDRVLHIASY